MDPSSVISGGVTALPRADVDTDQIIPKQFLKRIERTGFGEFLFYDWAQEPGWSLPKNPILATGANFGCGSSPRARPVGAAGLRLPGDRRVLLRRHLLLELHEDRPAAGRAARGRGPRADGRGRGRGRPRGARGALRRPRGAVRARRRAPPPAAERARRHRAHAPEGRRHRGLRARARTARARHARTSEGNHAEHRPPARRRDRPRSGRRRRRGPQRRRA